MYSILKDTRRHRYISFRIALVGENLPLTRMELIQALRQQTHDLFSKTTKELGLWVVQFDGTTGIIKCNQKEKEHTIQLLHTLKKIGSKSVSFTTYTTSGTIRGIMDKKLKRL
ncbi:Rpp14/Pop5 family protein [uncultured archaeon]|nr:Rpp14/Pop5 family protein [uncultured archaeon]